MHLLYGLHEIHIMRKWHPSVSMYNLRYYWTNFYDIWY